MTNVSYAESGNYPNAHIVLNRNRVKVYPGNKLFMENNTEFQLEFDNPTNETWLAKIKLNDELISDAGLVLRPGERVYLDTPDLNQGNKRRFKFETYSVDSDRTNAIRNNGKVEISFYRKKEIRSSITINPIYIGGGRRKRRDDYPCWPKYTWYTTAGNTNLNDGLSSPITTTCYNNTTLTSGVGVASIDYMDKTEIETGRVEQGSVSDQEFNSVYLDFDTYCAYSIQFQILPVSQKPATIQDVREYCSDCGRRRRKNEAYCPSCGKKF